jgi:hypothetical protein
VNKEELQFLERFKNYLYPGVGIPHDDIIRAINIVISYILEKEKK